MQKTRKLQKSSTYNGTKGREFSKKSITLPEQASTIRQLYDRAMRGLPLSITQREAIYNGDYVPDLSTMDLTEREEYRDYIQDAISKGKTNEAAMLAEAAAAQAAFINKTREEYAQKIKEEMSNEKPSKNE